MIITALCTWYATEAKMCGWLPIGTLTMRIATWNVNSIRQRLDHLLTWLKDCAPDIVCLQEIKCVDEAFPREAIESARLQRRHTRPEDLQRRRAAVEAAVR